MNFPFRGKQPHPSPGSNTIHPNAERAARRRIVVILAGMGVMLLLILLLPRPDNRRHPSAEGHQDRLGSTPSDRSSWAERRERARRFFHHRTSAGSDPSPEEVVAGKVSQFGRMRHQLVREIARRTHTSIPSEVEAFFKAVEAGDWDEINTRWEAMAARSGQYTGSTHAPELDPFWPAVLDAYGVAEQAHLWPAQQLLDCGNEILGSLKPGEVYFGGTDPGRWIPELVNETGAGEPHVIITQNALADARYLEFLQTLYGDRLSLPTQADSQRAFQAYVEDARKRLEHDQQFPDESKQLRPGEDVRVIDGKTEVSGRVAVMAINERIFNSILKGNPDVSFAMEQSFPFESTYAQATPAGPIMELRVQEGPDALTPQRAAETVDYWRTTIDGILAEDPPARSEEVQRTYSKLATDQAKLLVNRDYPAEAEETFRLATQMAPYNPEAVFGYVNLLMQQDRIAEAIPIVENAASASPDTPTFGDLLTQLRNRGGP